jgi:hypothetical protein
VAEYPDKVVVAVVVVQARQAQRAGMGQAVQAGTGEAESQPQ